ncbi:chorismate lyase [Pseudomonas sp. GD03842]|uniref:chorismate--pyruvate lyase family protein n=1 Tax=Pseudomonas sp. GD03842 TaxID=2975385 RepID=UPI0024471EBB|nr:chorismate lyase [Pseudomonas sp. GD03842]MDH0745964.1 chorismate lyase [Pseudomonas sp. GD03842]
MIPRNPAPTSPEWLLREQLIAPPAPAVLEWLFHEDSLTRRLTRLSNESFSVMPLFEGWQRLRADECAALQLPTGSEGWVREVYLLGCGEKWVFARSVAGRAALAQDGLHMDQLGTRSLGEWLFSDRAFVRGPLQVCQYPTRWLPDADAGEELWGRRSCFRRGPLSILVAEVFLPTVWQVIDQTPDAARERR